MGQPPVKLSGISLHPEGAFRQCRLSRLAGCVTACVARMPRIGQTPCLATLLGARHCWRIGPVCIPCAPLVHPLCIWTNNVNVSPLAAGVSPAFLRRFQIREGDSNTDRKSTCLNSSHLGI